MKLAWITGAHGFLGRHVARQLAADGWHVAGIGHGGWAAARREWGIDVWKNADIDLPNLDALAAESGRPELIFHAAGGGSVGVSLEQPFADFQRTVTTTAAVLDVVRRRAPDAHVIYPSSAAVYGKAPQQPIAEATPPAPLSPYGVHKLMAEQLCESAARHFGVRSTVIRFFSVYGPGLRKQLLWDLTRQLMACPREVVLHGTGEETRDFLHVDDAARLVALLALHPHAPAVVNGGSGTAVSIRAVATAVAAARGSAVALRFNGVTRAGDPPHYRADTAGLDAIGFRPTRRWDDGVREYVDWARAAIAQG
jgi:UDP-glucose 4-epimerase